MTSERPSDSNTRLLLLVAGPTIELATAATSFASAACSGAVTSRKVGDAMRWQIATPANNSRADRTLGIRQAAMSVRPRRETMNQQNTRATHPAATEVDGCGCDDELPRTVLPWWKTRRMSSPAVTLVSAASHHAGDKSPLRFNPAHLKGLAPAGRLDIDSTGLLVLTQDGRIAKLLIGEDSRIEKEYLVRVEGRLDERGLKLLNHGLSLDGQALKPAKVSWQNEDQLRFVLREGKKRQIRRMCELVGLKVTGLKRVRIGSVKLGDLPPGKWRYLREDERF